MPKRTNEFQQLILLIQTQLSGKAEVRECAELIDKDTGALAEVDVVVETRVGGIDFRIGIEVTAGSRPATQEWVREMDGKHASQPIDKTVLVAKAGFTSNAEVLAEARGITLLTFKEASAGDWIGFIDSLSNLKMASCSLQPVDVRVSMVRDPSGKAVIAGQTTKTRIVPKGYEGTLQDYVLAVLKRRDLFEGVMQYWTNLPPQERQSEYKAAGITFAPSDELEVLANSGVWHRVAGIEITLKLTIREAPVGQLTATEFQDHLVAYGTVRNIFQRPGEPKARDVIIGMIKDGDEVRTSLLLSGDAPGQFEVMNMEAFSRLDGKSSDNAD